MSWRCRTSLLGVFLRGTARVQLTAGPEALQQAFLQLLCLEDKVTGLQSDLGSLLFLDLDVIHHFPLRDFRGYLQ